jgi:hypothetical protein
MIVRRSHPFPLLLAVLSSDSWKHYSSTTAALLRRRPAVNEFMPHQDIQPQPHPRCLETFHQSKALWWRMRYQQWNALICTGDRVAGMTPFSRWWIDRGLASVGGQGMMGAQRRKLTRSVSIVPAFWSCLARSGELAWCHARPRLMVAPSDDRQGFGVVGR